MTTNVELLERLDINLNRKRSGSVKTTCPKCSPSRRNKKDPCLSVNIDEGTYNCHHCDFHGKVIEKGRMSKKEFILPPARLEKLEKPTMDYFENHRKISNNTLLRFKITDAVEWMPKAQAEIPVICFNYYRNDRLVNIKFRGKNKDFKLVKDAELIFYNLDAIKDSMEAIIVEGEIDCLSLYEAGIYNVVSVPNGASRGSQKLEYLDNCWEHFENKERIILMTDGDEAGMSLRDELARRLGKEKCLKVAYPPELVVTTAQEARACKDANELLVYFGPEVLRNVVANATEWPIEGILTVGDDLMEDIYSFWEYGFPRGVKLNIPNFDDHLLLQSGQFTTITGIPGSGKSEFIDLLMAQTVKEHNWKWGVCSFENQPASIHATKIMQKLAGKSFAQRKEHAYRMTQSDFEITLLQTHDHFTFVNINNVDVTIEGILDKFGELVKRKGIKGGLIDPWNYIESNRPAGITETEHVSQCLTKIKAFCLKTDIHIFLVAHPTKLKKENGKYEVATLYSISGSAHFFNKTDNGISVYRDFETNLVTVYVQKVRYEWNGTLGYCQFQYNTETRQYTPIN